MHSPETSALGLVKPGPYVPYRYTFLSPNRIRELSTLRPRRAMVDTVVCWLWILAAFTLVALERTWWSVLIVLPVIGNRYYGLFIIGHDAMHRRLFPNIKKNDFWADLLIFAPIGAITRINNGNHLTHHRLLATLQDPDRHKHACFNKADHAGLVGYLSGLLTVWDSARAVFVHRGQKETQASPSRKPYTLRDFLLLIGWFVVLAGGLTWSIGWWAYPVLWLAPVYLFMFLADNFRSFVEHSHPESDELADRHRLVTFSSNPIERMFVAPMNMNYHAVHHLWPSVPYYNLAVADEEVRPRADSSSLEWRGSYFAYLVKYWRALPLAECQKTQ